MRTRDSVPRAVLRWAAIALIASASTSPLLTSCHPIEPTTVVLTSAEQQAHEAHREHDDLARRLDGAAEMTDVLSTTASTSDQRALMNRLVAFFTAEIGEHARWEEQASFELVDARVGGTRRFTSSLRQEHELLRRWADDLARMAAGERPDVRAFVRVSYELVGAARAHEETEARVIQPILEGAPPARPDHRGQVYVFPRATPPPAR